MTANTPAADAPTLDEQIAWMDYEVDTCRPVIFPEHVYVAAVVASLESLRVECACGHPYACGARSRPSASPAPGDTGAAEAGVFGRTDLPAVMVYTMRFVDKKFDYSLGYQQAVLFGEHQRALDKVLSERAPPPLTPEQCEALEQAAINFDGEAISLERQISRGEFFQDKQDLKSDAMQWVKKWHAQAATLRQLARGRG